MTRNRKWLLIIALILLIVGALFVLKAIIKNPRVQVFGELIYRVETNQKVVALTFDDGPTPDRTEKILDILKKENVDATFFLNGKPLKNNPEQAKLLVQSGHQIANHSYSHSSMVFMSYDTVAQEIESTSQLLRDYGYQGELHFRPPFGNSLINLPRYLANNNIKTITWDVEPETWGEVRADSQEQVRRAMAQTKPGSIILMHVMYGDKQSMQAVTPIIRQLKQQGYRFVTINQLLALGEPQG